MEPRIDQLEGNHCQFEAERTKCKMDVKKNKVIANKKKQTMRTGEGVGIPRN